MERKETFTREEVSQLMKRRVERSHKAFFDRYGVKNLQELDNLFEIAKSYMEDNKKDDEDHEYSIKNIVGLSNVVVKILEVMAMFKKHSNDSERYVNSFCFVGEAGVGKTIAAKLLTDMLYKAKLIKRKKPEIICGDMIRCGDLPEIYKENKGGVVVFENACKLFETWGNSGDNVSMIFGLGEMMDRNRNKVITIFTDTEANMSAFLKRNKQISSRISQVIKFERYTKEELMKLVEISVKKSSYQLTEEAKEELSKLISYLERQSNYAGARTIKNVLEKLFFIQTSRAIGQDKDDSVITIEDVYRFEKEEHISRTILDEDKKCYEKELQELIGLGKVKTQIARIKAYALKNLNKPENLNLHLCFTGNPGTGKTEVAKKFAGILFENGVLPENKLVIKDRSELVAEYIGQTAPKVRKAVMESLGGVLFIDEAYMLDPGEDNERDFGHEALAELLNCMEEYRGLFAVILAGYKTKTLDMMERNPGLKSRINRFVDFPDYSSDELADIAKLMINNNCYICSESLIKRIVDIAETKREESNFANAREVRNILESLYEIQAVRTLSDDNYEITEEDIETYISDNDISFKKLGGVEIVENKEFLINLPDNDVSTLMNTREIDDRTVLIQRIRNGKPEGEGTGFIISSNGLIVTNNHVIDKADEIKVRKTLFLANGSKIYKEYNAKLYKTSKDHDAAIIVIENKDYEFPYFKLAEHDSSELDEVVMGGYPFGASRLNNISFNEGRVQSFNKDKRLAEGQDKIDRIYVDLHGVPGNSGSAVIDKKTGRVIGIYSGASLGTKDGFTSELNYAMPIKYVWDLLS